MSIERSISATPNEKESTSSNDLKCWPCTTLENVKESVHEYCYGKPCECECKSGFNSDNKGGEQKNF